MAPPSRVGPPRVAGPQPDPPAEPLLRRRRQSRRTSGARQAVVLRRPQSSGSQSERLPACKACVSTTCGTPAITTLAEKGLPDWVIQAQVGHIAPEMMKTYSHIRRQALNQAAAALEPTATTTPAPPEKPAAVAASRRHAKRVFVTVHVTICGSWRAGPEICLENGSSG